MEKIGDQKQLFEHLRAPRGGNETQRGELLKYFRDRVNSGRTGKNYKLHTVKSIGIILQGLGLDDLYYMQSMMEDKRRRGGNDVAWFWWSIQAPKP
jgi:hypothetical protein